MPSPPGLKRALSVRFPDRIKDVVVLAGDGATVDIGLDMTLQAWFRQEKFTTICFDNELYANTGGQESGLMQKGFVAKMAPVGKLFDKVRLPEIARESGCHYIVNCTVSKPSLVEKVVRNAVLIAREIGPTYLQLYTPCILEIGKNSMEGLQEMRDSEKPTERFAFKEYISEPAKQLLAESAAKAKEKKAAAKQLVSQEASISPPRRAATERARFQMSLDYVKFTPGFEAFMPKEYRDMVEHGPFGKKTTVSQMGSFKEILEEHPMCAGCAMTLFIRLAIIAFPNPEDTITVGTAGCGRLAISQAAIPFVYGNYGDQNGVASGLIARVTDPFRRQAQGCGGDRR